jgi:hypothetical protein
VDARLKLDEVVKYGRLDRSTVRYVLQSSHHLSGMPKAGSPGRHRQFTVDQAVKLALCAHLQCAGVPLKHAGEIWKYLQRELKKETFAREFPPERSLAPWILTIWDGVYLKLDCGGEKRIPARNGRFHISSKSIAQVVRKPLATYSLNLSRLRHELSRTAFMERIKVTEA